MHIKIIQPDDWHLHVRSGAYLKSVVAMSARQMARAIIMPNLSPPITSIKMALNYRQEIINSLEPNSEFNPLMTLYLTNNTKTSQIVEITKNEKVVAVKFYPKGVTTNSANGVADINNVYSIFAKMECLGVPLLIHGEVAHPQVDIFDSEAVFIDEIFSKIVKDFPELKIVFEHITTKEAVDFVLSCSSNVVATITPHHLLANRNDMLVTGIKPHYFCLPILKRRDPHQLALLKAATSANPKFFLGSDSAPHAKEHKESGCGCAGIFNAHCAIELYASVFESENALDKLEGFSSKFGPAFYNMPINKKIIKLKKQDWRVADSYNFANSTVIPFMSGQKLSWKLVE